MAIGIAHRLHLRTSLDRFCCIRGGIRSRRLFWVSAARAAIENYVPHHHKLYSIFSTSSALHPLDFEWLRDSDNRR
jgi:hypothetical protein